MSRKAFKLICLPALGLAMLSLLATAAQAEYLPKNTVPLTAKEMRKIYANKTWQWESGGGRFIAKKRRFLAYSEEGGVPTFAEGSWEVNNEGRLCMVAVWVSREGKAPARSCFRLVRDRGTVYQRREPKGTWFILRTFIPKPEDEARKLVSEDTVSPNVKRLKAALKVRPAEGG